MSANFTEFFGFMEDPFKRTPDIEFYFQSKQHQEALYTLNYLLSSDEGFVVMTGHPGTGKSITIRRFIHDLPTNVVFAYILFPNLMPEEMFQAVLEDFGIPIDEGVSKNALFSRLKDFLISTKRAGKQVLIIIDEAQNLPLETLEELRILSNLETDKEKLIKIALVGQPELDVMLNSNELRQLKQRVTLTSHLVNLTQDETRDYIAYRLQKAGRNNINISPSVVRNVWSYTHGNPRLINIVMQRAIIAAYMDSAHRIKKSHFDSAIKSLNMLFKKHAAEKRRRKNGVLFAVAAGILILAFLGYYNFFTKRKETLKGVQEVITRMENTTVVVPPVVPPPSIPEITPVTPVVPPAPVGLVNQSVAVNIPALNVREAPHLEARRIWTLMEGDLVVVKEETEFWVRIGLDDGDGWVYKRYVTKIN